MVLQPDRAGTIISLYPAARRSEAKIPAKGESVGVYLSPMSDIVAFHKIDKRFYSPVRQNAYAAG